MDSFDLHGMNYLVIADRYTGWSKLQKLDHKILNTVKTYRNLFAQYGVPLSVGDSISIQDRVSVHPLRWDWTAAMVERLQHRQFMVQLIG